MRTQIDKVRAVVKGGRTDASLAVPALQETLANERDILLNIQSYLTLPFNYSLCDCYNFSEGQKARLRQDVARIRQSLSAVSGDQAIKRDCPLAVAVRAEVARQNKYVEVLEQTLSALCCGKRDSSAWRQSATGFADLSNSQYQTNLKARNWIYGGMTAAELRLRYFSRSASANVTNCPLATPFASGGSCINCEGEVPIWNMRLERCVRCPAGSSFNESTKTCWQTVESQQSASIYHVVNPLIEKDVEVEPLRGKVIRETKITKRKRRQTEKEVAVAPLEGKLITSSKSSRWGSSSSWSSSGASSGSTEGGISGASNTFSVGHLNIE